MQLPGPARFGHAAPKLRKSHARWDGVPEAPQFVSRENPHACKLAADPAFGSVHALPGEEEPDFAARIMRLLKNVEKQKPDLDQAEDGHEHSECGFFMLENLPNDERNDQLYDIIEKVLK